MDVEFKRWIARSESVRFSPIVMRGFGGCGGRVRRRTISDVISDLERGTLRL